MIIEVKFEVRDTDEPGLFTWYEAMAHAKRIGDGWRLPTIAELEITFTNRKDIGGFNPDWYWSSTECTADIVWIRHFDDGYQDYSRKHIDGKYYDGKYYDYKECRGAFRLVRDIQEEEG